MEPVMLMTQERPQAPIAARAYASLLVHVGPDQAGSRRVELAVNLARELDAHLIGLGAETIEPIPAPDAVLGYGAGEWVVLLQEQVNKDLQGAETVFRRAAEGLDAEWRSAQDHPNRAMARTARAADLV